MQEIEYRCLPDKKRKAVSGVIEFVLKNADEGFPAGGFASGYFIGATGTLKST